MLGNSDIHGPDMRGRSAPDDHRTMTLVFATERSLEGVKRALQKGRTAVWFKDQIIGRKEWLQPLLAGCVKVGSPHVRAGQTIWLQVQNVSDIDINLERNAAPGPSTLKLPAGTTSLVKIQVEDATQPVQLQYTATNFLIAPETGLPVVWIIPGAASAEE
jgi:hypothetical protein